MFSQNCWSQSVIKKWGNSCPPQQQLLPVKSQLWCLPLAAQTLQMIRQTHYMEWQGTASVPPAAMPAEQRANINAVYVGCDKVEASLMTAPDSLSTYLKKKRYNCSRWSGMDGEGQMCSYKYLSALLETPVVESGLSFHCNTQTIRFFSHTHILLGLLKTHYNQNDVFGGIWKSCRHTDPRGLKLPILDYIFLVRAGIWLKMLQLDSFNCSPFFLYGEC